MRLESITDTNGRGCWVNADAVAYISSWNETGSSIHFIGAVENTLESTETVGEVAKKIRGALGPPFGR